MPWWRCLLHTSTPHIIKVGRRHRPARLCAIPVWSRASFLRTSTCLTNISRIHRLIYAAVQHFLCPQAASVAGSGTDRSVAFDDIRPTNHGPELLVTTGEIFIWASSSCDASRQKKPETNGGLAGRDPMPHNCVVCPGRTHRYTSGKFAMCTSNEAKLWLNEGLC